VTGEEETDGSGEGIGIIGAFESSSSLLGFSFGLGISFGGDPPGVTTTGGAPGVAQGAAHGSAAQQSFERR